MRKREVQSAVSFAPLSSISSLRSRYMPENSLPSSSPDSHRKPRWWPLVMLCILEVAWLLWVWERPAVQRQQQVLKTYAGIFICFALLLLWLVAFSRLRWMVRLGVLILLLGGLGFAGVIFRV